MNRFPDLTQVYFFPDATDVDPVFVHAAPAFTAPYAGFVRAAPMNEIETTKARHLFISSDYLALLDLSLNLGIQIWCCSVS